MHCSAKRRGLKVAASNFACQLLHLAVVQKLLSYLSQCSLDFSPSMISLELALVGFSKWEQCLTLRSCRENSQEP